MPRRKKAPSEEAPPEEAPPEEAPPEEAPPVADLPVVLPPVVVWDTKMSPESDPERKRNPSKGHPHKG